MELQCFSMPLYRTFLTHTDANGEWKLELSLTKGHIKKFGNFFIPSLNAHMGNHTEVAFNFSRVSMNIRFLFFC